MAELEAWAVTAAGNNTGSTPNYPVEGQAPSSVNDTMREGMAVHARHLADTNGTLTSGGAADAQTLTSNRTISAYAAGLTFVFKAGFTNTGAMTLNVSAPTALGADNVLKHNGDALAAGDITAGGIYMVIHDGTQFRLVGALATSPTLESLNLSSGTGVDLTDALNTLNVGPNSGQHLAMDGNEVQSKTNPTTVGQLNLNRLGGEVRAGAQSGVGGVLLWHDASKVAETDAGGLAIYDGTGDDPVILLFQDDGTTRNAFLQAQGSGSLILRNEVHGGPVVVQGENISGTLTNLCQADPDGQWLAYYAGLIAAASIAAGLQIRDTAGSVPTVELASDAGTVLSQVLHNSAMILESLEHGSSVLLRGEDTGGALQTLVNADPDAHVTANYAGQPSLRSDALGASVARGDGGQDSALAFFNAAFAARQGFIQASITSSLLMVRSEMHGANVALQGEDAGGANQNLVVGDPDGSVTLYEDGAEMLRTSDYTAQDIGMGGQVKDGGNAWRPVGMNVTPITSVGATTDLRIATAGHQLRFTAAVTADIDTTTDNAPDGAVWVLVNESGGNVSLTATGVTLKWLDGAGGQTGTRTLADGCYCTVTKRADGQYQLVGNGIT